MGKNSLRYCTPFSYPCLYSDRVIEEEQESAELSSKRDLETTLLDIRIKPKLKDNGQELTEILYPLLKPWMYSDRVIEEEQGSAELSSKRDL